MAGGAQEDDDDDEVEEGRGGNALPGTYCYLFLNQLVTLNCINNVIYLFSLGQSKQHEPEPLGVHKHNNFAILQGYPHPVQGESAKKLQLRIYVIQILFASNAFSH